MTPRTQSIIDKYYPEGTRLRDIYLRHCRSVADLAMHINDARGLGLDPDIVESAAMLHDIGIFLTDADGIDCHGTEPYIRHGILGAELLRKEGMPEEIARIAERHTGAGITVSDIDEMKLPLPRRDYMPETLLERLVCYADKFYSKTRLDSAKDLERVRVSMLRHSLSTLDRFDALHNEFKITP
ncbi:MAG: HDIG domain-containing protein [Muribaculaceae bacterium]|nr:HDIG domain-containing protein [Muribaculaceae bacterium]